MKKAKLYVILYALLFVGSCILTGALLNYLGNVVKWSNTALIFTSLPLLAHNWLWLYKLLTSISNKIKTW